MPFKRFETSIPHIVVVTAEFILDQRCIVTLEEETSFWHVILNAPPNGKVTNFYEYFT